MKGNGLFSALFVAGNPLNLMGRNSLRSSKNTSNLPINPNLTAHLRKLHERSTDRRRETACSRMSLEARVCRSQSCGAG
jgi:hypothetical protein